MSEESAALVGRWRKTGLLDGITEKAIPDSCNFLQNQVDFNAGYAGTAYTDIFKRNSIPLIRRLIGKLGYKFRSKLDQSPGLIEDTGVPMFPHWGDVDAYTKRQHSTGLDYECDKLLEVLELVSQKIEQLLGRVAETNPSKVCHLQYFSLNPATNTFQIHYLLD